MSFTGVSGNSTEWQDYLAEDRGVSELAVIWTFTGVALVFASARWYVRGWMQRRLRSDDYLIAISVVSLLPVSARVFLVFALLFFLAQMCMVA